jgi:Uma2 family endonuclease
MTRQLQEKKWMTPEEYLAFEKNSEIKHEFCDGEMFAMTGASLNHNRISRNIQRELGMLLKGSSCENLSSDMRVKIQAREQYTYPDIVIACDDILLEKIDGVETLLNPVVIIEILSDSTEAYDRGKKFSRYRLISSFKEYILVSQNHCQVERFVRGDDSWKYFSYEDMNQSLTIDSVDAELLLSDIYYRVGFDVAV